MTTLFTNNAKTTLLVSISSSATQLTVSSGAGGLFPSPSGGNVSYITLEDASGNVEIMKLTGRSTDVLTVVRGQDNTVARAFTAGSKVELRLVAAEMNFVMSTLAAYGKVLVPTGGIIMWDQPTIPTGWAICDGTNGTPDLRDRFILGVGPNTAVGAVGGSRDASLLAHSHTATAISTFSGSAMGTHSHSVGDSGHSHGLSDPGHAHSVLSEDNLQLGTYPLSSGTTGRQISNGDLGIKGNYYRAASASTGISVSASSTGVSISSASSGTPSGTVTTDTSLSIAGASGADKNLPPYYVLYFIKLIATNT